MTGQISYRVQCEQITMMEGARLRKRGGCGEANLHRDLARAGAISCITCGLEWPYVRLVTIWPDAVEERAMAEVPEALPPEPAPELPAPPRAALLNKLKQGDLF